MGEQVSTLVAEHVDLHRQRRRNSSAAAALQTVIDRHNRAWHIRDKPAGSRPVHVYSATYEDVLTHRLGPHPPLEGVEPAHPQSPLQLTQQLRQQLIQHLE